jgi:flagellar motor protein MotB
MAAGCKKCDPHEICEECPEWIFTLADLIMCMMGLFVIMWVLKPGMQQPPQPVEQAAGGKQAEEAWLDTVIGIRGGFGWEPDPNSQDPVDRRAMMKVRNGPGEHGKMDTRQQGAQGTDPEVTSIRSGTKATVGSRILFARGNDKISRDATPLLDQIAQQIKGHKHVFVLKGHTGPDDLPEGTSAEDKMALSVNRAKAVADYLMGRGVSPEVIRVQGCSTFEPVAARAYTPETQASNRRVEVESTDTLVEDFQAQPPKRKPGN